MALEIQKGERDFSHAPINPRSPLPSPGPSPTASSTAPVLILSNSGKIMDQSGTKKKYVKQVTGRHNDTELHLAAQRGDLAAVRLILSEIDAQMTGSAGGRSSMRAQESYEEEANLFVFRLKLLEQGHSRSLLTQAARHHAAQLNFFRKGFKTLEAVEPHVKVVADREHIDYQFSGLENDDAKEEEDDDDADDNYYSYDGNEDRELSFGYGQNDQDQDVVSSSTNSMELDQVEESVTRKPSAEPAKNDNNWMMSKTQYFFTSYLQLLLLWTGAT